MFCMTKPIAQAYDGNLICAQQEFVRNYWFWPNDLKTTLTAHQLWDFVTLPWRYYLPVAWQLGAWLRLFRRCVPLYIALQILSLTCALIYHFIGFRGVYVLSFYRSLLYFFALQALLMPSWSRQMIFRNLVSWGSTYSLGTNPWFLGLASCRCHLCMSWHLSLFLSIIFLRTATYPQEEKPRHNLTSLVILIFFFLTSWRSCIRLVLDVRCYQVLLPQKSPHGQSH